MRTQNGKQRLFPHFLIASVLMIVAVGCGSPAPIPTVPPGGTPGTSAIPPPGENQGQVVLKLPDEEAPIPKEQLLDRWMVLAKSATREKPNIEDGVAIAREMAQSGPAALAPLLDVLADKASSPFARALASMSLMAAPDASQLPRVIALTKPENDLATRLCATGLLGAIPGTEADAALKALAADPERQVRFQAMRGLATRSPEGRKAFAELLHQPGTTPQEKSDIISVLAVGPVSDSIGIFQDAVKDTTIDESARVLAVQVLGRMANQSSLAPLTECMEKDPSEKVRTAAKTAIEALKARLEKAPEAPPSP